MSETGDNKKLFWACFIALVATSFFYFKSRGGYKPMELEGEGSGVE